MSETPIKKFCIELLNESKKAQDKSLFADTDFEEIGKCKGQSWTRKLLAFTMKSSFQKMLPLVVCLYLIAIIIRLIIFKESRINWTFSVLSPFGVILMVSDYASPLLE